MDLERIIKRLRHEGCDNEEVEAKTAQDGFPERLAETVCAFANRPDGGLILLGLQEAEHFKAVGVYDIGKCLQHANEVARRAVEPPVHITCSTHRYEGADLVAIQVHETDPSQKPVRVKKGDQEAFLRQYDGNFELSDLEVQAFIAGRTTHHYDLEPVEGADPDRDLNADLVGAYVRMRRSSSTTLASASQNDILTRTGVLTAQGQITIAGLLGLGVYPQQFFPTLSFQAYITPGENDPAGTRALDSRIFAGPLSVMLDDIVLWVARNTRNRIRIDETGMGVNEPDYPEVVVRELVANALIHRDVGPHARSSQPLLRLNSGFMVISNPGGLHGLSVRNLGRGPSHTRNCYLADIATHLQTQDGKRVIERLGSGIPTAQLALRQAQMQAIQFHDSGLQFTAKVYARSSPLTQVVRGSDHVPAALPVSSGKARITPRQQLLLQCLGVGPLTRQELVQRTGLSSRNVAGLLRSLRQANLVGMTGGRGHPRSEYFLVEARPSER